MIMVLEVDGGADGRVKVLGSIQDAQLLGVDVPCGGVPSKEAERSGAKQIEPSAGRLDCVRVPNDLIVPSVFQNEGHISKHLLLRVLLQLSNQFWSPFLWKLGIIVPCHLVKPEAVELETSQPVFADVGDKLLRAGVIVVQWEHIISVC